MLVKIGLFLFQMQDQSMNESESITIICKNINHIHTK
jgi:hypothetical protein